MSKKIRRSLVGQRKKKKPYSKRQAGADTRKNLLKQALVNHQAGRLSEAEILYRKILLQQPEHPEALHYLGLLAHQVGKNEVAAELFSRAIASKPGNAEAHYNLGNVLDDLGRKQEAVASYKRAIALKPDYIEAYYNLGLLFQAEGKSEEAAANYSKALSLRPDYVKALNNLGIILKDQGRLNEACGSFQQAISIRPDYLEAHSNLLFCLTYMPDQPVSRYLEAARHYGQKAAARAREPFSSWYCDLKPERLRVGLVSDDFHNHPVGYFLENMLAHINSNKIELCAYPVSSKIDDLTERIRPRFKVWNPLSGKDDKSAAELIHHDGIHVLLDLSGHTSNNRLPLFAWKPAPVQAAWLGYFATTGVTEMDYIIADRVSIPESHHDQFMENVWYLPETRVCFSPPVLGEELPISALPALSNGFITFGCFQNLAKLNDQVLDLWGRIFQKLPRARLRLQNSQFESSVVRDELQDRLARKGIEPDRVIFKNATPRRDYLAAHAEIDIILDTFPFSGLTTTCEALWMGVPTITLAGNTMVSCQGASLLTCANLTDWIGADHNDYETKTLTHAGNLGNLARLREGLRRQVLASPLFDGPRFARHFETALQGMWHNYQSGL